MRARMTGAVCLHSLMALWQMYVVMFPDNPQVLNSLALLVQKYKY